MDALKRSLGLGSSSGGTAPPPQASPRPGPGSPVDPDASDGGDVRTKIMGLWHSMKYGGTLFALNGSHPSSFTGTGANPVWFLGVCYQGRMTSQNKVTASQDQAHIQRTKVSRFSGSVLVPDLIY